MKCGSPKCIDMQAVAAVLRHDRSVRGLVGGLPTDSIITVLEFVSLL